MRKELGKSLLKIIGFGIISSPLALIGHMYYSSTQVDKQKYINNIKDLDMNKLFNNVKTKYGPDKGLD